MSINSEPAAPYLTTPAHPSSNLSDEEVRIVNQAINILEAHLTEKSDALTSPEAVKTYLRLRLSHFPYEVFSVLFLDNRHQVIAYQELFRGTIDGASVYPREVIRECIRTNAAAVIFAHNHPSGVAEPSQADIRITERLREALKLIDVRTLDHIIIGDTSITSLAERGLL